MKIKDLLDNHFKNNLWPYILNLSFLILGIAGGAVAANTLPAEQLFELKDYLSWFFTEVQKWEFSPSLVAQTAILNNLKTIFALWFLGLTVVGVPLILIVVGLRGFILGFTVSFLMQDQAVKGLLLAAASVLPQSLINLPCWLVAGVLAIRFSGGLISPRWRQGAAGLWSRFGHYTVGMILLVILAGLSGLVEAYLSPWLLRLVLGI